MKAPMGKNDEKTRAIVAAAIEQFDLCGFAGANMDRIAETAQVSKRTVYNHFESKEALFHAIWDEMVTMANASIDIRYNPARPVRPQLQALGLAIAQLSCNREYMQVMRLAIGEFLRQPTQLQKKTSTLEHDAICTAMFTAAVADGALATDDPGRAAAEFLALIKAGSFWPSLFSGDIAAPEAVENAVASAVNVILKAYAAGDAHGERSGDI